MLPDAPAQVRLPSGELLQMRSLTPDQVQDVATLLSQALTVLLAFLAGVYIVMQLVILVLRLLDRWLQRGGHRRALARLRALRRALRGPA